LSLFVSSSIRLCNDGITAVIAATSTLATLGDAMSWILSAVIASLSRSLPIVANMLCMFDGKRCIHNDFKNSSDTLPSASSFERLKKRDGRCSPSSASD